MKNFPIDAFLSDCAVKCLKHPPPPPPRLVEEIGGIEEGLEEPHTEPKTGSNATLPSPTLMQIQYPPHIRED